MVVGHAHLLSLEYVGNVRQIWNLLETNGVFSQFIFNSSLAVDSFLLISGTVLAFKIHSRIVRQKHCKKSEAAMTFCHCLILYIHRITRLMPAYLMALLVIFYIFKHLGDGPMWSQQKGCFFKYIFFRFSEISMHWISQNLFGIFEAQDYGFTIFSLQKNI